MIAIVLYTVRRSTSGIRVYYPYFVKPRPKKSIRSSGKEIAAGSWNNISRRSDESDKPGLPRNPWSADAFGFAIPLRRCTGVVPSNKRATPPWWRKVKEPGCGRVEEL